MRIRKRANQKSSNKPVGATENSIDKDKVNGNLDTTGTKPKRYVSGRKARAGKRAIRSSVKAALFVVLCLAFGTIVITALMRFTAARPRFEFISTGRIEHTIGARALIVRDETLVISGAAGDVVTKATEGSRVSNSQTLALVVPEDMSQVVTNLRNTQSQISDVQQEVIASGKASGARQIYDNIDEDILPIINLLRVDSMSGKINDISSYESSLAVLLDRREKELLEVDFEDERLTLLRSDASSYENQLTKNASIIKAPNPGIVSYKLDGKESQLNFDFLLTSDFATISKTISESVGIISSDMYVEKNEPVARVSQNEEQYIAVILDLSDIDAERFEVDSTHNINIASEGVAIDNCKVVRSTPSKDGLLVVFSTTRHVESLIDLRTVDIEIVVNATSGLRIPTSSLVNPDYDRGVATIYVNGDGFATEVDVLISDYDREFAIVTPFGDNDIPNSKTVIIINPSSVKPGDKVS